VRELGANAVIDHRTQDVAVELRKLSGGRGVDAIIDPVQGAGAKARRGGLRVGGRHVLCGHAAGLAQHDPDFYLYNHTLVGVNLGGYGAPEMMRMFKETQTAVARWMAEGLYRPNPAEVIGFEDVPAAITALANRDTVGRICVRI
jgi:NADPH2:quinone reductase